ncbi:MAG: hypothetical protein LBF74_04575 [Treponema sp.]|jgi:hypothetical protein|nr:hypothetical protein [Treponema sp.]
MKTLPAKNYTPLSSLNQLCLPMDVGVLIPPDDSVRLLVFVLKQLDLTPLYEAYNLYCERRRREQADRKRNAAERDVGKLPVDEAESTDTHRRIGTIEAMSDEVQAWVAKRNSRNTTIQWQFTTKDARIKLQHLYPKI